jgi:hypothetical protein
MRLTHTKLVIHLFIEVSVYISHLFIEVSVYIKLVIHLFIEVSVYIKLVIHLFIELTYLSCWTCDSHVTNYLGHVTHM